MRLSPCDLFRQANSILRQCTSLALRLLVGVAAGTATCAEEINLEPYQVSAEPAFQQLSPDFCWFHPRVAPMPGFGKQGQPAVLMTIQKHLVADDHYSGMYMMRTDDLGKTWSGPTQIPELDWYKNDKNETISVCDTTPLWHLHTKKILAIGTKLRYSEKGHQLLDEPKSHECAYAIFDPQSDNWTKWKMLALPDVDTKFQLVAPGCVQFIEKSDGSLLVPMYYTHVNGSKYTATVLHCSFDGQEMKYLEHGNEMTLDSGIGFAEPSLAHCGDKYFLTLRSLEAAYVTSSDDGLHFQPVKKWTFDDGKDLGSYNTQAHWIVKGDALFLCYTRRGANNDHIARNRAPIFVAQVDPRKLQVIRTTEKPLLPERGVMLGNFGATTINDKEAWVTDAEFSFGDKPHARGADGTVWVGRVKWESAGKAESEKPKAE